MRVSTLPLIRGASILTLALAVLGPPPAAARGPAAQEASPRGSTAAVSLAHSMPMDGMPGMAQLMEILGPGVACPRGGCGFGLDGIPEPYAGGGLRGPSAAAADASGAVFPASGASLMSWLSTADLTGRPTTANDIWGYVSPSGREYAIVGLREGTAFVDVTDARSPEVIGVVPGPDSLWRDMKTHGEFAYAVNERGGGLQVIDLREIDAGRVRQLRRVTAGGLRTGHNLHVNPDSGFAYILGSNLARGGLLPVDLSDPATPVVGSVMWNETYVHDVLVASYASGRYAGREIAFAFTGREGIHIVDVSDKDAPRTLSHLRYRNATYGHSGALSENRRLLYVNDELDERSNHRVDGMTTYVVRVSDLEAPRLVRTVRWKLPFIDHNSMVRGDRLYLSAYEGGLRIIDISRPSRPVMEGWLDTYPDEDAQVFSGAWGVYAGFPSGNVVVSDVVRGLFVVRAAR